MLQLSSTDFQIYYKPSKCDRRIYLYQNHPEWLVSHTYENLVSSGDRHLEKLQLKQLKSYVNLSKGTSQERLEATSQALKVQDGVFFKPLLLWQMTFKKMPCMLWLQPDFLIREAGKDTLLHCKMAKNITKDAHPEIFAMVQFNNWLYQIIFDKISCNTVVYTALGKHLHISAPETHEMEATITTILKLKQAKEVPYSPVSRTKCKDCGFSEYCWEQA